jgi:hypothetical protein
MCATSVGDCTLSGARPLAMRCDGRRCSAAGPHGASSHRRQADIAGGDGGEHAAAVTAAACGGAALGRGRRHWQLHRFRGHWAIGRRATLLPPRHPCVEMGTVTIAEGGFFYNIKLEPERQVRAIHTRCPRLRDRCRATTCAHSRVRPHHPCAFRFRCWATRISSRRCEFGRAFRRNSSPAFEHAGAAVVARARRLPFYALPTHTPPNSLGSTFFEYKVYTNGDVPLGTLLNLSRRSLWAVRGSLCHPPPLSAPPKPKA